jgi:hypothetical protein
MVSTSAALLGILEPSGERFGVLLAQHPEGVPPWLEHVPWSPPRRDPNGGFLIEEAEFYRLYRVDNAILPP